jgi:Mrp family chromosome partitioning ATPase
METAAPSTQEEVQMSSSADDRPPSGSTTPRRGTRSAAQKATAKKATARKTAAKTTTAKTTTAEATTARTTTAKTSTASMRRAARRAAAKPAVDDVLDDDLLDDDALRTDGPGGEPDDVDTRAPDGSESRLPATTTRPGQRTGSPVLRYDQIPNEVAEALRGIINRSELRAKAPLPKSIAVTSALLGEGVTTTSQSMATLIAQEMNSFVCWVDCSWLSAEGHKPDVNSPNLIDILADQSLINHAFQSTNELPNLLSFSPGAIPDARRNTIVRSPEFERLLGILADEFDHVVFDLPPVLTNANALALLRRADASLLVVRHRATSLAQVERAIEAMQPTPNLGVLLNHYRTSIPVRLRRLLGE